MRQQGLKRLVDVFGAGVKKRENFVRGQRIVFDRGEDSDLFPGSCLFKNPATSEDVSSQCESVQIPIDEVFTFLLYHAWEGIDVEDPYAETRQSLLLTSAGLLWAWSDRLTATDRRKSTA